MSGRVFSFYGEHDGMFTGRTVLLPARFAHLPQDQIPPGLRAIEGRYDRHSQRVDLQIGAVVDYQPPQPSADHIWNATRKRWALSEVAAAREHAQRLAQRAIEALELTQVRAVRELLLEPNDRLARDRLRDIDTQIAALRAQLPPLTQTGGDADGGNSGDASTRSTSSHDGS